MARTTVLIVDDDIRFADNLRSYLDLMGYETGVVGTGRAALKLIEGHSPDILLCDLKLPDIDGDEVVRKTKEISPKTRLFMISAYVDGPTEERLQKLGVSAFIHKPVMFDNVLALFKQRS